MEKIEKPWGYEIIWAKTDKYVGKILHINPHSRLSRQYHKVKEETIMVKSGTLHLQLDDEPHVRNIYLIEGQTFHIEPRRIHRFCAKEGPVELIEVSTTELDDVVRLSDDYRR